MSERASRKGKREKLPPPLNDTMLIASAGTPGSETPGIVSARRSGMSPEEATGYMREIAQGGNPIVAGESLVPKEVEEHRNRRLPFGMKYDASGLHYMLAGEEHLIGPVDNKAIVLASTLLTSGVLVAAVWALVRWHYANKQKGREK